jgi:hypothetical protein
LDPVPTSIEVRTSQIDGLERIFRVKSTHYEGTYHGGALVLQCQYCQFDGEQFGLSTQTSRIENYNGNKKISELSVCPLKVNEDIDLVGG